MDFSVSEKMQTILGMIDEFVDKELIPLEPEFITPQDGHEKAVGNVKEQGITEFMCGDERQIHPVRNEEKYDAAGDECVFR